MEMYDSILPVYEEWASFVPGHRLFFQSAYLKMLEECPPDNMRFRYVLLYQDRTLVGCLYFQIVHYNAYQSMNLDNERARKKNSWGQNVIDTSKEYLAKSLDLDGLILGNLLTTGQNAFYFVPSITLKNQVEIADVTMNEVRELLIQGGINTKLAFVKDFPDDYFGEKYLSKSKCQEYYRLEAYPNMVMNVDPAWQSFDDYMNALKSKYRVSNKKAIERFEPVEKRLLRPDELGALGSRMYALYRNISSTASFNLFFLNPDYFPALGQHLEKEVSVYGYFLDGELIGFYTVLHNEFELDAHFLGYDPDLNREYMLYKNMLLDMVREAIEHNQPRIIFSRTAMGIKSSIGAVEQDMSCYIQHKNRLQNLLFARFFDWLKPDRDWIIREPFKDR